MSKSLLFLLCILLPWSVNADLKDAFEVYTTNPSTMINSRYMQGVVGASFHARNPNMFDKQLFSVQAPSWNAGCGGIDFFSGSFSVITKDELVQIARGIAQGAPGYFFQLAIDSVCPSCGANMKELASRLNSWNSLAQESCTTFWDKAVEMTGNVSLTERTKANVESRVQTDKAWLGFIPDYGTWMSGGRAADPNNKSVDPSTTPQDLEYIENNAIMRLFTRSTDAYSDPLNIDLTPYELYMSFIGSAIITVEDDEGVAAPVSDVKTGSIDLKTFLFGPERGQPAEITLTKCDLINDPQCLSPVPEDKDWDGLVPTFSSLIYNAAGTGILQLMNKRQDLSADQIKFVNTYPYNYVSWAHNCYVGAGPYIADYIAHEVTFATVDEVFTKLENEAALSLINDGLQPEHFVTPEIIEKQMATKRKEFDSHKDNRQAAFDKTQKDLQFQLAIALKSNKCNSI